MYLNSDSKYSNFKYSKYSQLYLLMLWTEKIKEVIRESFFLKKATLLRLCTPILRIV